MKLATALKKIWLIRFLIWLYYLPFKKKEEHKKQK